MRFALFLFILFSGLAYAQEVTGFKAEIIADDINVRSDSTASAEIICKLNKGDSIEVVLELYDWYKIEPLNHSFGWIHKQFVKKTELP